MTCKASKVGSHSNLNYSDIICWYFLKLLLLLLCWVQLLAALHCRFFPSANLWRWSGTACFPVPGDYRQDLSWPMLSPLTRYGMYLNSSLWSGKGEVHFKQKKSQMHKQKLRLSKEMLKCFAFFFFFFPSMPAFLLQLRKDLIFSVFCTLRVSGK